MRDFEGLQTRKASIKETGEELSQDEWRRFDVAVAEIKAERGKLVRHGGSYRLPDEIEPSAVARM